MIWLFIVFVVIAIEIYTSQLLLDLFLTITDGFMLAGTFTFKDTWRSYRAVRKSWRR